MTLLGACGPAGSPPTASRATAPPASITAHAIDVVAVRTAADPGGPLLESSRGDPKAEPVFNLLPDRLPPPLVQPPDCRFGNMITLFLKDGESIDYGPCLRPAAIEAIRCFPSGGAGSDKGR